MSTAIFCSVSKRRTPKGIDSINININSNVCVTFGAYPSCGCPFLMEMYANLIAAKLVREKRLGCVEIT